VRSSLPDESSKGPVDFKLEVAQESIQRKVIDFDPTGDAHYDLASAFHQEHARQRS
jgi:replication-associated recombination protein RarA